MITTKQEIKIGYKQTELGVIPEDWDVGIFGACADIYRGGSPRPIQSYLTHDPDGINWIKIGDVNLGARYITSTEEKINQEGSQYSRKVNVGDFLLSNSMSFGRPYVLRINGCIHDGWLAIQNYKEIFNTEYLYYILSSKTVLDQYFQLASGSSVLNLNKAVVSTVKLPIPKVQEQSAIAAALSDADELIEKLERLIKKKKNIKQGAIQELLTGKKRLPGFSGKWEIKTIEEVADCLDNLRIPLNENQRAKMQGGIPYCGANGVLDYVNNFVIDDDIILIAEDGGYFDEYYFRPIAYRMVGKCWVNNHAHILKAKEKFDQGFIYYSLVHKNILSFLASGTRAKLNKSEMYKIEIAIAPSKEEQTAIANVLSEMDEEIEKLESQLIKYQNIKQGMMQQLLTGKIRIYGTK